LQLDFFTFPGSLIDPGFVFVRGAVDELLPAGHGVEVVQVGLVFEIGQMGEAVVVVFAAGDAAEVFGKVFDGGALSLKTVAFEIDSYTEGALFLEGTVKNELTEAFSEINIKELRIGAVIGCHGGPALVGFLISEKYNFEDFEG